MKKRTRYIIYSVVLILFTTIFALYQKNIIFSDGNETDVHAFSVKDTASITKIFLADMNGHSILLSRTDAGWTVNDSTLAMGIVVEEMLGVMRNIIIKQPVNEAAQENVSRRMAQQSVKVEVYQNAPKFTIFGIPFSVKERNTHTMYIGEAIQTQMGNYAVLEGMDEPYIVGMLGFRGFLTPRFSTKYEDWVDKTIFRTKITRIASMQSIDAVNPEESFSVTKAGARHFTLTNYQNQPIHHYDTVKLVDMLSEYRERYFEGIVTTVTDSERDSVLQFNKFKTIILTDVENNTTTLDLYKITFLAQSMENNTLSDEVFMAENKDRCYGVINNDISTFCLIQYHYFDRQLQPLSYFLKQEEE